VVALANDIRYGIGTRIFTREFARSLRIAKAVRSGIVLLKTYRVIYPIAKLVSPRHWAKGVKMPSRQSIIIRGQSLSG